MNKALFWLWRMGVRGLASAAIEAYRPIPGGKYHNGRKPRRREAPNSILGKRKIPALGPEDGLKAQELM